MLLISYSGLMPHYRSEYALLQVCKVRELLITVLFMQSAERHHPRRRRLCKTGCSWSGTVCVYMCARFCEYSCVHLRWSVFWCVGVCVFVCWQLQCVPVVRPPPLGTPQWAQHPTCLWLCAHGWEILHSVTTVCLILTVLRLFYAASLTRVLAPC